MWRTCFSLQFSLSLLHSCLERGPLFLRHYCSENHLKTKYTYIFNHFNYAVWIKIFNFIINKISNYYYYTTVRPHSRNPTENIFTNWPVQDKLARAGLENPHTSATNLRAHNSSFIEFLTRNACHFLAHIHPKIVMIKHLLTELDRDIWLLVILLCLVRRPWPQAKCFPVRASHSVNKHIFKKRSLKTKKYVSFTYTAEKQIYKKLACNECFITSVLQAFS